MLVTHFTVMSPGKSGMYESTKDQIKYERKNGLDSHLIDTLKPENFGKKDDWLETVEWKKAFDADVWVVHSNLPLPLEQYIADESNRKKHKIVTIMHGPVENMLLKEFAFMLKNIDEKAFTITHINAIWNWDACVVLNQHEYDVSVIYDEYAKLIYIPNSIDVERQFENDFAWKYRNRPAIISADYPRLEKLPAHILLSMPKVIERIPEARLNIFALPIIDIEFWRYLVCRSKNMHLLYGCVENFHTRFTTLAPFIKGADIGFNNNYSGIMSRVHMEMMLAGVPIVSYNGDYTTYHAKVFDLNSIAEQIEKCWNDLQGTDLKERTIQYALDNFDRSVHVKQYISLYERLLGGKSVREDL